MSGYRVTTYRDGQVILDYVVRHPALDGIRVKGFVRADDNAWSLVLEPVTDDEGPEAGQ